ncbi:ubiquinone/menaquinone biosynthesis C-methylase UbiE [Lipingzhangella halophila]|uniref:Ubiquinone/menaquinone biosynthesis C-methylase UbiE n=1 Tax=Lipingzhangella halophila TaxID=1783352 RepID=A0A7W7W1A1_9ACTN|nr:class I SAM-dependent methyltransferase [Lipingzhangella halophila]MBB4930732.1 ubiquinone/menaquinone biosynthesis C-methylase UbiE [Lipingzhangella halophila]
MARRRDLWTGAGPGANPFALPRGPLGWGAGWFLARANRTQNAEVAGFLRAFGGGDVLEVGHGPGILVELLARQCDSTVTGVDPSAEMVRMARRRNAGAVRAGRVRLRRASAQDTGCADESVDLVVTVNTVAMWPRLDGGLTEFHRVLRPGGRAVVTWHRTPERFALTPDELDTIEVAVRKRFGTVERHQLPSSVVFSATR